MNSGEKKILGGILLFFVTVLSLALGAWTSFDQIGFERTTKLRASSQKLLEAERLRADMSGLGAIMPLYILSADAGLIDRFAVSKQNVSKRIQAMVNDKTKSDQDILMRIQSLDQPMLASGLDIINRRKLGMPAIEAQQIMDKGRPAFIDLRKSIDALVKLRESQVEDARDELAGVAKRSTYTLASLTFLALALAGLSSYLMWSAWTQHRSLDQARREAIETVAHDLKNPLATVRMSLDLLDASPPAHAMALRSISAMERLIANIMDHSRIQSGNLRLDLEPCDLRALVREIIERHRYLAERKGLELKMRWIGDVRPVSCDARRIEQVLANLLGNAIKFTTNGRVEVQVAATESGVEIIVLDSGVGIAATDLPHVFDRFWQAKGGGNRGLGLGLAIVKGIIDAHGGQVSVESQAGHGSSFHLFLPN